MQLPENVKALNTIVRNSKAYKALVNLASAEIDQLEIIEERK